MDSKKLERALAGAVSPGDCDRLLSVSAQAATAEDFAKAVEKVVKEMTPGKKPSHEPARKDGKNPEEVWGQAFEDAVHKMMVAIDEERGRKWKRTTKEAARAWCKTLIKYIDKHD